MIVVMNDDGTVRVGDDGLPLVSESDTPTGSCCCDVPQTCCIDEIGGAWPLTVTVTITDAGGCACLEQEVTADYTLFGYGGQTHTCNQPGATTGFTIDCSGSVWSFNQNACRCPDNFGSWTGRMISCVPFHLIFENVEKCAFGGAPPCCDGFVTIEVTE